MKSTGSADGFRQVWQGKSSSTWLAKEPYQVLSWYLKTQHKDSYETHSWNTFSIGVQFVMPHNTVVCDSTDSRWNIIVFLEHLGAPEYLRL